MNNLHPFLQCQVELRKETSLSKRSSCFARRTLPIHPILHITSYTLIRGDVTSSEVKGLTPINHNSLISITLQDCIAWASKFLLLKNRITSGVSPNMIEPTSRKAILVRKSHGALKHGFYS